MSETKCECGETGFAHSACITHGCQCTPARPAPEGPDFVLRPEVLAFAQVMEWKLRQHDATRGASWRSVDVDDLLDHLEAEVTELRGAVHDRLARMGVAEEAADVGNLAMMVADRCGKLSPPWPAVPSARAEGAGEREPVAPTMVERLGGRLPRRACVDLMTPAERALYDAMDVVESVGAHPRQTDAVLLLNDARSAIADAVEALGTLTPAPGPPGTVTRHVCRWCQRALDDDDRPGTVTEAMVMIPLSLAHTADGLLSLVGYRHKVNGVGQDAAEFIAASEAIRRAIRDHAALSRPGTEGKATPVFRIPTAPTTEPPRD